MRDAIARNAEARAKFASLYPYAGIAMLLRRMAQAAARADHGFDMTARHAARGEWQRLHAEYLRRVAALDTHHSEST